MSYSCELCKLHNLLAYAHKYYSGKKAKGATNHLVMRFKTYFIGGRMLSTSKSGQEPMVVELIDNRGECTTLFFLFFYANGLRMRLPSKFILI